MNFFMRQSLLVVALFSALLADAKPHNWPMAIPAGTTSVTLSYDHEPAKAVPAFVPVFTPPGAPLYAPRGGDSDLLLSTFSPDLFVGEMVHQEPVLDMDYLNEAIPVPKGTYITGIADSARGEFAVLGVQRDAWFINRSGTDTVYTKWTNQYHELTRMHFNVQFDDLQGGVTPQRKWMDTDGDGLSDRDYLAYGLSPDACVSGNFTNWSGMILLVRTSSFAPTAAMTLEQAPVVATLVRIASAASMEVMAWVGGTAVPTVIAGAGAFSEVALAFCVYAGPVAAAGGFYWLVWQNRHMIAAGFRGIWYACEFYAAAHASVYASKAAYEAWLLTEQTRKSLKDYLGDAVYQAFLQWLKQEIQRLQQGGQSPFGSPKGRRYLVWLAKVFAGTEVYDLLEDGDVEGPFDTWAEAVQQALAFFKEAMESDPDNAIEVPYEEVPNVVSGVTDREVVALNPGPEVDPRGLVLDYQTPGLPAELKEAFENRLVQLASVINHKKFHSLMHLKRWLEEEHYANRAPRSSDIKPNAVTYRWLKDYSGQSLDVGVPAIIREELIKGMPSGNEVKAAFAPSFGSFATRIEAHLDFSHLRSYSEFSRLPGVTREDTEAARLLNNFLQRPGLSAQIVKRGYFAQDISSGENRETVGTCMIVCENQEKALMVEQRVASEFGFLTATHGKVIEVWLMFENQYLQLKQPELWAELREHDHYDGKDVLAFITVKLEQLNLHKVNSVESPLPGFVGPSGGTYGTHFRIDFTPSVGYQCAIQAFDIFDQAGYVTVLQWGLGNGNSLYVSFGEEGEALFKQGYGLVKDKVKTIVRNSGQSFYGIFIDQNSWHQARVQANSPADAIKIRDLIDKEGTYYCMQLRSGAKSFLVELKNSFLFAEVMAPLMNGGGIPAETPAAADTPANVVTPPPAPPVSTNPVRRDRGAASTQLARELAEVLGTNLTSGSLFVRLGQNKILIKKTFYKGVNNVIEYLTNAGYSVELMEGDVQENGKNYRRIKILGFPSPTPELVVVKQPKPTQEVAEPQVPATIPNVPEATPIMATPDLIADYQGNGTMTFTVDVSALEAQIRQKVMAELAAEQEGHESLDLDGKINLITTLLDELEGKGYRLVKINESGVPQDVSFNESHQIVVNKGTPDESLIRNILEQR